MSLYQLGDLTLMDGCRTGDFAFVPDVGAPVENVAIYDSVARRAYRRQEDGSLLSVDGVTMHCRHGAVVPSQEPALVARTSLQGGRSPALFFHATALLVHAEIAITEDATWQELGGLVTNPAFFPSSLAATFGQLSGASKVVGAGAELRLVQDTPTGLLVLGTWGIADTADAWAVTVRVTEPSNPAPFGGTSITRLEGRLNGATSALIKYMSLSLMEVLP